MSQATESTPVPVSHYARSNNVSKIRELWAKIPSHIKSGIMVLIWTFLGVLGTLSVEFVQEVATWLSDVASDEPDAVIETPKVSFYADALLAAGVAFISGLVALVGRTIQKYTSLIPGNPPEYNPPVPPA